MYLNRHDQNYLWEMWPYGDVDPIYVEPHNLKYVEC